MEVLGAMRPEEEGILFRPEIPWERARRQGVPPEKPSGLLLVVTLY